MHVLPTRAGNKGRKVNPIVTPPAAFEHVAKALIFSAVITFASR